MNSLADQLKSAAPPVSYRIAVPPGWRQFTPDPTGEAAMTAHAVGRFRQAGRPDVEAVVRRRIREYFEGLRRAKAVAVYLPGETDDETPVPMSVVAFRHTAERGTTSADVARSRSRGTAVEVEMPSARLWRWQEDREGLEGEKDVSTRTLHYLVAAPDDARRAILFSTALLHVTGEGDAEWVTTLELLSDAIVGTFRWTS